MPREKHLFDVRDRASVPLRGGIYDGMPLYNADPLLMEARIPCKTTENGVTLQVYRRSDINEPLVWDRYERADEPDAPACDKHVPGVEFMVQCPVADPKADPNKIDLHYITELGCWLKRARRVGVTSMLTVVSNTDRCDPVNRLVAHFGARLKVATYPPTRDGKIRHSAFGLKTMSATLAHENTKVLIVMDLDTMLLRPCPDLILECANAVQDGAIVTTLDRIQSIKACADPEKSLWHQIDPEEWKRLESLGLLTDQALHYNNSLFAMAPHHRAITYLTIKWHLEWNRYQRGDELPLTAAIKVAGTKVRVLDVRYNRYIWDMFYRYQVGLLRENLWLDDVVGLQAHVACLEIAGGVGYRKAIEDIAGIPHSSSLGADIFSHALKREKGKA